MVSRGNPAGVQWRVGRAVLGDQEVQVVQATDAGQLVVNLYFDESGLLVRLVRWTHTPVGFVPTQIDSPRGALRFELGL